MLRPPQLVTYTLIVLARPTVVSEPYACPSYRQYDSSPPEAVQASGYHFQIARSRYEVYYHSVEVSGLRAVNANGRTLLTHTVESRHIGS